MKSLAEHLGVDLAQSEATTPDWNLDGVSAKEFARLVLGSAEYRVSLMQRLKLGALPPAVEALLYHYAFGKPVERVEVKDKSKRPAFDEMTEQQIQERMRFLQGALLRMRAEKTDDTTSVH